MVLIAHEIYVIVKHYIEETGHAWKYGVAIVFMLIPLLYFVKEYLPFTIRVNIYFWRLDFEV